MLVIIGSVPTNAKKVRKASGLGYEFPSLGMNKRLAAEMNAPVEMNVHPI
jgi:hypothetical protein